jgi:tRNA(Ile)-lysidine synthase
MSKYIVAVSGGVDSVVLLDMLSRANHQLIVAHVDHGIRGADSAADARFVHELARRYKLPVVSTELGLGAAASEEQARELRYQFLFAVAKEHGATVVTAHHRDDLIETIALNVERGTGWRGLAVMARPEVRRPLLALTKQQLYSYALEHQLEWVEDETNTSDLYQRNRLRRKLAARLRESDRSALLDLRARQLSLRTSISREVTKVLARHTGSRHFLAQVGQSEAVELLGTIIEAAGGSRPLRPRLVRALLAVKTAKPGTTYQVGEGVSLHFTARNYTVSVL